MMLLFLTTTKAQKSVRDSLKQELKHLKSKKNFTPGDTVYINTLNKLGEHVRYYKLDSLLHLSKEALKNSQEISYKKGEILALIGIADYHSDRGFHAKGISYYEKALKESEAIEDTELILNAENSLAVEYDYNGNLGKSLREYLKGIEIATNVGNTKMLSVFNENISLLYAAQKDYGEALNYLKKAKKLNDKINDEAFGAYTLSNLASVHADAGNYEHAMFNANQSIAIFEKNRIMDWLAYAYETKGSIYLKQEKFKWALYWYGQSRMLHDKNVEDQRSEIALLQGLSEANLGLGKDSIAEIYARKAFELSTKLHVRDGLKNASQTLYKLYKDKNEPGNALAYHELFQKHSDTIARNKSKKDLLMLTSKMNHEKQKEDLILGNEKALAKQKNYVTGILGLVLLLTVITFLVKRSEGIQKNLNKELTTKKSELEKNELELLEINETKDKLFSIIGHDLRGPIGAFQGLLQMFKKGEVTQKELISFIPKLKSDIDHISFTLNNLLSWGQSQMNGSMTKPSTTDLEHIVTENINLLSEIALNKSIKVINKVVPDSMVWSDPDQIDIVIRNLISNALKFTPENGSVTISAFEKDKHLEISVQDTGVGMDQEIQEKLFAKNSNHTTYGTANEKGTGLGLNLCKEMVEKNEGTIWVNSIPNQGTCFKFTLLRSEEAYEKAS